ncbi:unnamed protein product [Blepharisma stoltei]|uniref:Uncharacterized protein n=1 Tax=Blepharisma stoltei TaxID=1481888 RepID=A0AAU9K544_9CILI|nr:unnamed protein product [Blepharisma stoltei]
MGDFPYSEYTSGWTNSKPTYQFAKPSSSKEKKPPKEQPRISPGKSLTFENTQATLKDLCSEDKAKVGELVKRLALEKSKREELEKKAMKEIKDKEKEIKKVRKANQKIQEEAEEVGKQLAKARELINSCQMISTPQPIATPVNLQQSLQSWNPAYQNADFPEAQRVNPQHSLQSWNPSFPSAELPTHPQEIICSPLNFTPSYAGTPIPDFGSANIQTETFTPDRLVPRMLFTQTTETQTPIRETATSPIEEGSNHSRCTSICTQTVCDKEIQADFEEVESMKSVDIQADSIHEENPIVVINKPAFENRARENYGKASQFTQNSYESEYEPEAAKSIMFEPTLKQSHVVNNMNYLKQDLSALTESLKSLKNSRMGPMKASIMKSPPQTKHVAFRGPESIEQSTHNPLLFDSIQYDSRLQSILERAEANSQRAKKLINQDFEEIPQPKQEEKQIFSKQFQQVSTPSQSFQVKDLQSSKAVKQSWDEMPILEEGFYDDTLFQLVDDLEKMESCKNSASSSFIDKNYDKKISYEISPEKPKTATYIKKAQIKENIEKPKPKAANKMTIKEISPEKPKSNYDKNLINIIDNFESEDFASSLASSKRSNYTEEDSFEALRNRAYKLRETFKY